MGLRNLLSALLGVVILMSSQSTHASAWTAPDILPPSRAEAFDRAAAVTPVSPSAPAQPASAVPLVAWAVGVFGLVAAAAVLAVVPAAQRDTVVNLLLIVVVLGAGILGFHVIASPVGQALFFLFALLATPLILASTKIRDVPHASLVTMYKLGVGQVPFVGAVLQAVLFPAVDRSVPRHENPEVGRSDIRSTSRPRSKSPSTPGNRPTSRNTATRRRDGGQVR